MCIQYWLKIEGVKLVLEGVFFFLSMLMIVYVYLGYPLLVAVIGTIRTRRIKKGTFSPKVTILIAAYNEEENIEITIINVKLS